MRVRVGLDFHVQRRPDGNNQTLYKGSGGGCQTFRDGKLETKIVRLIIGFLTEQSVTVICSKLNIWIRHLIR